MLRIEINAGTPEDYKRALGALADGLRISKDLNIVWQQVDAPSAAVGKGPLSGVSDSSGALTPTEEPDEGYNEADHAAADEAEGRTKRKRRTKAEIEAARAAEAAGEQTDIETAIASVPVQEQSAASPTETSAPAPVQEPTAVDESIFDPPAFLKKDHSESKPEAPTLQERAEALTESISMDFVQAVLGKLEITKLGAMDDAQATALERVIKLVETNLENFKTAIADPKLSADYLAQAAIDKSKGGK